MFLIYLLINKLRLEASVKSVFIKLYIFPYKLIYLLMFHAFLY